MTNTGVDADLKLEFVSLESFQKDIASKFEKEPYHFEPGSLRSELTKHPALKFCVVQDGSLEYPGRWGSDGKVLIQERELPENGRVLYWYRTWEGQKKDSRTSRSL
jgi:hypothetical protein